MLNSQFRSQVFKTLLLCSFLILSAFQNLNSFEAKVIGIKDGDTIEILLGKQSETLRLEGIDCPEKNQDFGNVAKKFTAQFCYGKTVRIEFKGHKDRYQRKIAKVYVHNKCLNEELLKAGLAWHFKKYSKDPHLAQLEYSARIAQKGLWQHSNPIAPWEWRKHKHPRK